MISLVHLLNSFVVELVFELVLVLRVESVVKLDFEFVFELVLCIGSQRLVFVFVCEFLEYLIIDYLVLWVHSLN